MSDQTPVKLCPDCTKGFILTGTATGVMRSLAGVEYYVALPPGVGGEDMAKQEGENAGKVIVILTDIFGLGIENPKLMADQVAAETKIVVVVPDILFGDPASPAHLALPEQPLQGQPLLAKTWAIAKMLSTFLVFIGPAWLYRHRESVTAPIVEKFCVALRKELGFTRIGAVGYCFGGVHSTKLATSTACPIDVVITAHPGSLTLADFEGITKPFALLCSQEDFSFDQIKPKVIELLEKKKTESALVFEKWEYPGTTHGFAARPNLADTLVKDGWEKSMKDTVGFFARHL